MNKIQISHESPLCLLDKSLKYNDYDYALVHLFEQYSEYFEFFVRSIKLGRRVILDNSIFELGKSFEFNRYAHWIEKLAPTDYIVPDVLEGYEETISLFNQWDRQFKFNSNKIGVIQGKNYNEIVKCYKFMDKYADKIAISFDYSWYINSNSNNIYKWEKYMIGRQSLLTQLLSDNIINVHKPHHLLGISLPQEMKYYNNNIFNFIESVDTSNPVVHSIKNIKYTDDGLFNKESIKLIELFNYPYNKIDNNLLEFNIQRFKQFTQGI